MSSPKHFAVFTAMLFATAALMAQQSSPTPHEQPDTSLTATPTPQAPLAQNSRRAPNPNKQMKHLAKALHLTQDQVAQIRPLLADRSQKMEQLRTDTTLAQRDRRMQMINVQQESKAKIEALLSDTQKQQFEQMLSDHRNRRTRAPQS